MSCFEDRYRNKPGEEKEQRHVKAVDPCVDEPSSWCPCYHVGADQTSQGVTKHNEDDPESFRGVHPAYAGRAPFNGLTRRSFCAGIAFALLNPFYILARMRKRSSIPSKIIWTETEISVNLARATRSQILRPFTQSAPRQNAILFVPRLKYRLR